MTKYNYKHIYILWINKNSAISIYSLASPWELLTAAPGRRQPGRRRPGQGRMGGPGMAGNWDRWPLGVNGILAIYYITSVIGVISSHL